MNRPARGPAVSRSARARGRTAVVALALLLAHAGCAVTGSYEPRPSPRISPVDVTGQRVFVRDGRRYEVGLLAGGGAEDLVRGNELALSEARKVPRNRILGWLGFGLGVGATVSGGYFGLERDRQRSGLASELFFGGFASLLASIAFTSASNHHLVDAVDIFNDGLEPPAPAVPP